MTNREFSDLFDVWYNNITSNQAPGLNEFEKSVFLTKAQYDIVKAYFSPRENKVLEGFDGSRKRQMDFSKLMALSSPEKVNVSARLDDRSICYEIPEDLFLFINESFIDGGTKYVVVPLSYDEYDRLMQKPYKYPVKHLVWRLITNNAIAIKPNTKSFGILNKKINVCNQSSQSVSLIIHVEESEGTHTMNIKKKGNLVEIEFTFYVNDPGDYITLQDAFGSIIINASDTTEIEQYLGRYQEDFILPDLTLYDCIGNYTYYIEPAQSNVSTIIEIIGKRSSEKRKYTIRYIKRPSPIVLENFSDGLSIDNVSTYSECILDPECHPEILLRAVELAKAAYTGNLADTLALGQTSQTDIGIVTNNRQ